MRYILALLLPLLVACSAPATTVTASVDDMAYLYAELELVGARLADGRGHPLCTSTSADKQKMLSPAALFTVYKDTPFIISCEDTPTPANIRHEAIHLAQWCAAGRPDLATEGMVLFSHEPSTALIAFVATHYEPAYYGLEIEAYTLMNHSGYDVANIVHFFCSD
jgi:hypothetical protein